MQSTRHLPTGLSQRQLIDSPDQEDPVIKFDPQSPRYRIFCRRLHVRTAAGFVTLVEFLWITYQLAKILILYIVRPQKYAEIFLATFIICTISMLVIAILISAVLCKKPSRLIPYMILNILSLASLLACIFVSILKSTFDHSHPSLSSMASSIVPSFDLFFYLDFGSRGEQKLDGEHKRTIMLLIISLSSILLLVRGWFLRTILLYYHFLKDLETSTTVPFTAVFAIR